MNKDSKIFVAGGTGMVGSAIINTLLLKGYTNIIASYRNRLPNKPAITTILRAVTDAENIVS